jgi:predicted phage terminase large subunit-like protein
MDKPIKRLFVEMPPRHGKSSLDSTYFPAWHACVYPTRDLILTSATDDLVMDFSQAALDLVLEYGPGIFGKQAFVRKDVRARHRWQMLLGGAVRAAGVGGSIMGRGAHGLLVDDYLKNMEEALSESYREKLYRWYLSTASTRLARKAWVVIIATRWHKKDLIGRLLEDMNNGGERWARLRLPAIAEENDPMGRQPGEALWPEMFPISWLETVKDKYCASGYEWMWESLYQQNPPDVLDAEFSPAYFPDDMWFQEWPELNTFVHRIQTCDPSLGKTDKSDYQAHILMGLDKHGRMWIEGDLRRRDRVQIVSDMLDLASWFKPEAVGIESNMWQVLLADELYAQSKAAGLALPVWPLNNWENKLVRIRATLTPYLSRQEFKFRNTPGTQLLVEQLKGFPACKFDDGPDSLELAVRLMRDVFQRGIAGDTGSPDDEKFSQGMLM